MPSDDRAPPAVARGPEPPVAGQHPELTSPEEAPAAGPDAGQRAGQGGAGESRRDRTTGTDPVAWLIALAAFLAYDLISVFKYLRLAPGSWDLGIFTPDVNQVAPPHAPRVGVRGTRVA